MAHQHYRTKALFLKKENRGEADQMFVVFSQDFGKLEILGKAIRKITSKLRSGADLFYISEIEFIQGKTYKILTDAVVIEKFQNIRSDSQKIELAYSIADAVNALVGKQQRDDKIWSLLMQTLRALSRADPRGFYIGLPFPFFFWNLAVILGYGPQLYKCPVCRQKLLPANLFFSTEHGGVVCGQCQNVEDFVSSISADTVKVIRFLLQEPIEKIKKLKLTEPQTQDLENISQFYFTRLKEAIQPRQHSRERSGEY